MLSLTYFKLRYDEEIRYQLSVLLRVLLELLTWYDGMSVCQGKNVEIEISSNSLKGKF